MREDPRSYPACLSLYQAQYARGVLSPCYSPNNGTESNLLLLLLFFGRAVRETTHNGRKLLALLGTAPPTSTPPEPLRLGLAQGPRSGEAPILPLKPRTQI